MDRARRWRKTHGSVPYEVPTPNYEDPLTGPYTEHMQKLRHSPASAQYWTSSCVAGTLSLDTSLGSLKTRQLTEHSGVTSTYLSDTFLKKAGGVVRAAQATDGSTTSAGTTTTYHQLICGGDPSCEVIRGWRYGPCRLRVNDDATFIPLHTSFHFISCHLYYFLLLYVFILPTVSLCVCHNLN